MEGSMPEEVVAEAAGAAGADVEAELDAAAEAEADELDDLVWKFFRG